MRYIEKHIVNGVLKVGIIVVCGVLFYMFLTVSKNFEGIENPDIPLYTETSKELNTFTQERSHEKQPTKQVDILLDEMVINDSVNYSSVAEAVEANKKSIVQYVDAHKELLDSPHAEKEFFNVRINSKIVNEILPLLPNSENVNYVEALKEVQRVTNI